MCALAAHVFPPTESSTAWDHDQHPLIIKANRDISTYQKKTKWTAEEDRRLTEVVKLHGTGNWSLIAQYVTGRNRKQCRERWIGHLCPSINANTWTVFEDQILLAQQRTLGNSWSQISQALPGRSTIAIKNRWSVLQQQQRKQMPVLQPQWNSGPSSTGLTLGDLEEEFGCFGFAEYSPQ
jgi:hypothetical protein